MGNSISDKQKSIFKELENINFHVIGEQIKFPAFGILSSGSSIDNIKKQLEKIGLKIFPSKDGGSYEGEQYEIKKGTGRHKYILFFILISLVVLLSLILTGKF